MFTIYMRLSLGRIDFIWDLKLFKVINGNYSDVADSLITITGSINCVLKMLKQIPTLRINLCQTFIAVAKIAAANML